MLELRPDAYVNLWTLDLPELDRQLKFDPKKKICSHSSSSVVVRRGVDLKDMMVNLYDMRTEALVKTLKSCDEI